MIRWLGSLIGFAPSSETTGWVVSVVVHVVGVAIAATTLPFGVPAEDPSLNARLTASPIHLRGSLVEPEPPPLTFEAAESAVQVVVGPTRVRINERTFRQTSTDVSLPTPEELAFSEVPTAVAPAQLKRRRGDESPAEALSTEAARSHPPSRRLKTAGGAVIGTSNPASVIGERSTGTHRDEPPRLLYEGPLLYPDQAVVNRQEGTVILRVHLTAEGRVAKLEVASSSGHRILDAAALRSVRSWRFSPALRDGSAVPGTVRLPVRFSLE